MNSWNLNMEFKSMGKQLLTRLAYAGTFMELNQSYLMEHHSLQNHNITTKDVNIRIMILMRRKTSSTKHSSSRVLANKLNKIIGHIILALKAIENISFQIVTADFSGWNVFSSQVALSHNIDILIGFHGAGINHMFHMNPNCCGVIELFPEEKMGFTSRVGYGNHARFLGYYYERIVAFQNSFFKSKGTFIQSSILAQAIQNMTLLLLSKSTYLMSNTI
mmetsp:Transcript_28755/g.40990  ORF Transcript_28755/g.40990 Transcript_28755/m.40990 type:complete len:219 (+) Transcript_28755:1022-1678(+)